MAISDDTAVVCPKVPTEPRTSPLGRSFYPMDDDASPQVNLGADLAGISMAINVLNGLLANSEAFRDRQTCGAPEDDGEWPLPPTCVEGGGAAVHYLSRYGECLGYRLGEVATGRASGFSVGSPHPSPLPGGERALGAVIFAMRDASHVSVAAPAPRPVSPPAPRR